MRDRSLDFNDNLFRPIDLAAGRDGIQSYQAVRKLSKCLVDPLKVEDFGVQAMEDVSPPKWHLAHTTWFFETFILNVFCPDYLAFDRSFAIIFNSYYEGVGAFHARPKRHLLFRPTLEEVFQYREYVDGAMEELLASIDDETYDQVRPVLELGINHEQQHQELLLTDIKYNFFNCPSFPIYDDRDVHRCYPVPKDVGFTRIPEGVYDIGHEGDGFSFDNELPRHKVYLSQSWVANQLVTNGEYLEFITSGGYNRHEFWLSQGWDFVRQHRIQHPLYWILDKDNPKEFTLQGIQPLDMNAPVSHLNYFEALAYAEYVGCRIPTEFEWEVFANQQTESDAFLDSMYLTPWSGKSGAQCFGHLWQWTQSSYSPYPGFKPLDGKLGEYNGKFMCGQYVLRGGSYLTSRSHFRSTYRNFFLPKDRWQATGLRLAKDFE